MILDGMLQCTQCSATYRIHKGIPYLIIDEELEESKAQEMKGWVSLWEKKGMYEQSVLSQHIEQSFKLPYLGGPICTQVARMFDMALEEMDLTGNETILDLGAGVGWASRYFAEKGCKVIATDIVDDQWYGLGHSWAIMEDAGVYFNPLLMDGERLAFPNDTFDIVFFCAALHHFERFDQVLKQVNRVLKPGGRLIATGEPAIDLFTRERNVQATLEEVEEGIIERRAKVYEYWWAIKKSGFTNIQIDISETYNASAIQVYSWLISARNNTFNVVRTRYKALVWLFVSFLLMLPVKIAASLAIFINGGNLFIRARKPTESQVK